MKWGRRPLLLGQGWEVNDVMCSQGFTVLGPCGRRSVEGLSSSQKEGFLLEGEEERRL